MHHKGANKVQRCIFWKVTTSVGEITFKSNALQYYSTLLHKKKLIKLLVTFYEK